MTLPRFPAISFNPLRTSNDISSYLTFVKRFFNFSTVVKSSLSISFIIFVSSISIVPCCILFKLSSFSVVISLFVAVAEKVLLPTKSKHAWQTFFAYGANNFFPVKS